MRYRYEVKRSDIVGKKLLSFTRDAKYDGNSLEFQFEGEENPYEMYHNQDCCEHVRVVGIQGDLNDLVGKVVTEYNEEINPDGRDHIPEEDDEWSSTTTQYTFEADGVQVVLTWVGTSNGYYDESVQFVRVRKGGRRIVYRA